MTKPLPPGTINFPLNMTRDERNIWGQFAQRNGASMNQTIQQLAAERLREINPALAAEIEKIRRQRGMVVHIAKTAVMLFLGAIVTTSSVPARRGATMARRPTLQFRQTISA